MRLSLLLLAALVACRTAGLPATDPTDGDVRSAAMTINALGCMNAPFSSMEAEEIRWEHGASRMTIDLYGVNGSGCRSLPGGALVDAVANTLFVFFDAVDCDDTCPVDDSHVQLVISDDLHGLVGTPTLVETTGTTRPDFSQVFGEAPPQFAVDTDYTHVIPEVSTAAVEEPSPTGATLSVGFTAPACAAIPWQQTEWPDTIRVIPYVTQSSDTAACGAAASSATSFLSALATSPTPEPVLVLSKTPTGDFAFVQATR